MSDVMSSTAQDPPQRSRTTPLRGAALARRRLALWGGTLLCLGWLSHGWQISGPGLATRTGDVKGADYIQFYIMGGRIQEGRSDLGSASDDMICRRSGLTSSCSRAVRSAPTAAQPSKASRSVSSRSTERCRPGVTLAVARNSASRILPSGRRILT